jgi:CubicO group peptidase (beta-lactamase class C family)
VLAISCTPQKKTTTSSQSTINNIFTDKLDSYLESRAKSKRFNGNILIAQGDSILYRKSYGLAQRQFAIPNSDSTKFLIGSITKPFTAYAVLLLVQQQKLTLNSTLDKFFPSFPNAQNVTIHHLLTHTSGIRDYHVLSNWRADSKRDITPQYVVKRMAEQPYRFEPGTNFRYSNTGYILLGLIIEQVTQQSFASFLQDAIFTPLGLDDTGVINNNTIVLYLAEGYTSTLRTTRRADYINYNQPFASGNMYSTPYDLCKFTQAVMNSTLLPIDVTEQIFTNNSGRYGYGWGIRSFTSKACGHHGGMNGFIGSITYIPESKMFLCFLTTDDNTPKYSITEDIVALVTGNLKAARISN